MFVECLKKQIYLNLFHFRYQTDKTCQRWLQWQLFGQRREQNTRWWKFRQNSPISHQIVRFSTNSKTCQIAVFTCSKHNDLTRFSTFKILLSSGLFDEIFTIVWLQDLLATPMHEDSPGCKWIGAASSNTISSGTTYRAIWSPSKLIMGRTLHRAFLLFSL